MHMQGTSARLPYVVATAHSPAPVGAIPMSPTHRPGGCATLRTASPLQGSVEVGQRAVVATPAVQVRQAPAATQVLAPQDGNYYSAFTTPRMASRPRSPGVKTDGDVSAAVPVAAALRPPNGEQPAWAFRTEHLEHADGAPTRGLHMGTNMTMPQAFLAPRALNVMAPIGSSYPNRVVHQSPTRSQGTVLIPRSPSPVQMSAVPAGVRVQQVRTSSPVHIAARMHPNAYTWSSVPAALSPRTGTASPPGTSASRATSPVPMAIAMSHVVGGFSFNPDPPSPRIISRTMSPTPPGAITFPAAGLILAGPPRPAAVPVPVRR